MARKYKEIYGDVGGAPADHPELLQKLKQAVDNELKLDYLVTGGCMLKPPLFFTPVPTPQSPELGFVP